MTDVERLEAEVAKLAERVNKDASTVSRSMAVVEFARTRLREIAGQPVTRPEQKDSDSQEG